VPTFWVAVAAVYAIASVAAFAAYAVDKNAARTGAWRTPESTLHLLAVVGGWPGALLAQLFLRHKTQKSSFRAMFWVTVLVNCAVLVGIVRYWP
jgi:uncharacterized membrane protein YsdA (DUF1294 family)